MKALPKILVTRNIPKNGIDRLKKFFLVEVNNQERDLSDEELRRKLKNAFGVVAMMANKFDRELLSRLDSLRVISNFAVGFDNVDVAAATEKGIVVTNTPGVLTDATADLTFGLLLAVARRIAEGDRLVRSGNFTGWTPMLMLGTEVSGKTLGIIGAGRIGSAVAKRSVGFGMKILYFSRAKNNSLEDLGGKFVGLESLLRQSDFVSINVPLNAGTRDLIGKKEIGMMKRSSVLVNTSRGEVVDEKALIAALRKKQIAGAGLDVYRNEPEINREFVKLENVVLAPHIGSATRETRFAMAEMAAQNAIAVLENKKPLAVVNPEALGGAPHGK